MRWSMNTTLNPKHQKVALIFVIIIIHGRPGPPRSYTHNLLYSLLFVFKRNILEKKRGIVESSRQKELVRNGCFSMTTLPYTRVLPVNTLYSATRWSFVSLRREQVLNLFPRFDGTHIHPHRFYLPVSLFFPPFFSFFFFF